MLPMTTAGADEKDGSIVVMVMVEQTKNLVSSRLEAEATSAAAGHEPHKS